jgi:hypothetical protein
MSRASASHRRLGVADDAGQLNAALVRLAECLLRDRDRAGAELELHAPESNFGTVLAPFRARLEALGRVL